MAQESAVLDWWLSELEPLLFFTSSPFVMSSCNFSFLTVFLQFPIIIIMYKYNCFIYDYTINNRIFMARDRQEWLDRWLLIHINYNTFFFFKLFSLPFPLAGPCFALFVVSMCLRTHHIHCLFVHCIVHVFSSINHNWWFFPESQKSQIAYEIHIPYAN